MNKLQFGVVAAIGAYFAYTVYQGQQEDAAIAKKWGLNEAQVVVMEECERSLSRHDKKFKQGIDETKGCACIAQRATKDVQPARYAALSEGLDIMVEASTKGQGGSVIVKATDRKPNMKKLAMDDRLALLQPTMHAIGWCGSAENHMSPDLQKISIEEGADHAKWKKETR